MKEINAILAIAYRDFKKFTQDRPRILATFIFPFLFIGVLGASMQANINQGYNFLTFIFTGVIGQTLFQSTAAGVISLVQDRESDFAQEMFVSPISRYSIIVGKILGESLVALVQLIGVVIFALIAGVPVDFPRILGLAPVYLAVCLVGGAFGVIVLSNLSNQRSANQLFPFLLFPQFFLAGVFNPIKDLPPLLLIASRIAPMTYAIDLIRSVYYFGQPEYNQVVLYNPLTNLLILSVMFVAFISLGTFLFVKNERNR